MTERGGWTIAAAMRIALRIGIVLGIAWGAHLLMGWAAATADDPDLGMRIGLIVLTLAIYAILLAIPFVPGVEIGLTLMAMEGAWIAPWIYLATVCGLSIAYTAGAHLPYTLLHRIFADLRLHRAAEMLHAIQPLDRQTRLDLLRDRLPQWLRTLASRFRYVLLALLVNLPGNSVIGGGGGILFLAGFSRVFHPFAVLATIVVAVAPVPLLVWGFGFNAKDLFH
jgi:hypothetical protein